MEGNREERGQQGFAGPASQEQTCESESEHPGESLLVAFDHMLDAERDGESTARTLTADLSRLSGDPDTYAAFTALLTNTISGAMRDNRYFRKVVHMTRVVTVLSPSCNIQREILFLTQSDEVVHGILGTASFFRGQG